MHAAFVLGSNPATARDETALSADPVTADLMGQIVLTDDNAAPVTLADDLEFLIPNLCLRAPVTLAAEGSALVTMASWPGSVTLVRDGEAIRLLDQDETELGRFPAAALTAALRACAGRFRDYIGALAEADPEWHAFHAMLTGEGA